MIPYRYCRSNRKLLGKGYAGGQTLSKTGAYRSYRFKEQERLLHSHNVTHLFLTKGEYEENCSYYEELGKKYSGDFGQGQRDTDYQMKEK